MGKLYFCGYLISHFDACEKMYFYNVFITCHYVLGVQAGMIRMTGEVPSGGKPTSAVPSTLSRMWNKCRKKAEWKLVIRTKFTAC